MHLAVEKNKTAENTILSLCFNCSTVVANNWCPMVTQWVNPFVFGLAQLR